MISYLILLGAVLAAPRPSSASQDPALYFVCTVFTRGVSPGTTYISDVIGPVGLTLNNKSVFVALGDEFQKFVADKYNFNSAAACTRYTDEDNARNALKQTLAKPPTAMTIVETHWKRAATVSPAPAPAASAPQSAKPAAGGAAFHGFCSANFPGSIGYSKARPTYFTPIFGFPKDGNYGAWFGEYIAKKYGFQPWPAASCRRQAISINMVEFLQADMAKAKELGAPSVVQTDWTSDTHQALMAELAKNAPPKPTPSAPPAVKKSSDDDAPPTTKPTPAPGTIKPAASPVSSAKPPAQGPTLYSYCYAYGTPAQRPTSPAKQHFYITPPFELAASDRPNMAFQNALHAAHPGETISASCLSPGTLDAAQKSRQTTLDLRRKQAATFDIVEVDWKFTR